jgi:hypothetical protein
MPGEIPPLTVERNIVSPAGRNGANGGNRAKGTTGATWTGQERIQRRDDWIVQNREATFLVLYDARTGTLRHLSWSDPGGAALPHPIVEGPAGGPKRFDPARAAASTRHILHRLGIPEADGPWKVASSLAGPTGTFRRVYMESPRWCVWSMIDPDSAEVLSLVVSETAESRRVQTP